jgi:hypothetical protein
MANIVCKSWKVVKVEIKKNCCLTGQAAPDQMTLPLNSLPYPNFSPEFLNYIAVSAHFPFVHKHNGLKLFLKKPSNFGE